LCATISATSVDSAGAAAILSGARAIARVGVESPPAVEGGDQPRGDLRIAAVDRKHLIGDERNRRRPQME
jgi:hypothetical protein